MVLIWMLIIAALLFALYLWMIRPARKRPDASMLEGWLYAHRGLHDGNRDIPENSLAAFALAADQGYGMELDVQLTADDQLVVFHDKTLKRVCGVDKPLYTLTYEELRQYPLPDGSVIPLFSEVLELVAERVPMIVEVKYHHRITETARATHQLLSAYNGAYCVESFHPLAMRYFRRNAPQVIRGQLAYGGRWKKEDNALALHCAMKHLLVNCISRPHFVAYSVPTDHTFAMWMMKRVYRPLLAAWTIRDQHTLDQAQEYNYPIFELFTPDASGRSDV